MVQYKIARLDPSAPPATCLVPVRIENAVAECCNPVLASFNPFGTRLAAQFAELPRRPQRRSAFRFDYERGKGGILSILYRIIRRPFHAESDRYTPTFLSRLLSIG
jgi:hypothetical protein